MRPCALGTPRRPSASDCPLRDFWRMYRAHPSDLTFSPTCRRPCAEQATVEAVNEAWMLVALLTLAGALAVLL